MIRVMVRYFRAIREGVQKRTRQGRVNRRISNNE